MNKEKIKQVLKEVKFPGFSRDIVSFGMIKEIVVDGDSKVSITLSLGTQNADNVNKIINDITLILIREFSISKGDIKFKIQEIKGSFSSDSKEDTRNSIPKVKNIIAIASGKGGVGKSTFAVNFGSELSKKYKVGILDLDIYGPSLPMLIGEDSQPKVTDEQKLIPVEKFGMKLMSFGFINSQNSPTIWRGPMVAKLTTQFFDDVIWEDLDYLILDLPPGTGDIQLTLVQRLAITGAIIITTPQNLALLDVKKGADMFKKVNTPVLGVVENMTHFLCPHCQQDTEIFPGTGGKSESKRLGKPLLGQIFMSPDLAISADAGEPYVFKYPNSVITNVFSDIAEKIVSLVR